jgi:hypothetical protein
LAALAGEGYIKATEGIPLAHFKRTIEVLARGEADPTLMDREGRTPMQLAKQEELQYLFGLSRNDKKRLTARQLEKGSTLPWSLRGGASDGELDSSVL